MTSEEAGDEIVSAVVRRKIKLERELVTASPECSARIAEDIQGLPKPACETR
jgi:hypothetical protein